jgi:hypothetical protein
VLCHVRIGVGSFPARGVTEPEDDEYALVPTMFIALTLNMYDVPLVRPVTVTEVEADGRRVNVVHVEPEFDEYWTV